MYVWKVKLTQRPLLPAWAWFEGPARHYIRIYHYLEPDPYPSESHFPSHELEASPVFSADTGAASSVWLMLMALVGR
jgi:hypothetical protein